MCTSKFSCVKNRFGIYVRAYKDTFVFSHFDRELLQFIKGKF